jgi:hypothetical protein
MIFLLYPHYTSIFWLNSISDGFTRVFETMILHRFPFHLLLVFDSCCMLLFTYGFGLVACLAMAPQELFT